jgi:hypothetical protein
MKVFDRTIETKKDQITVWGLERLLVGLGIEMNFGVSLSQGDLEEKRSNTNQNEVMGETINLAFEEDDWGNLDEIHKPLEVDEEQDMMREMIEVQNQHSKPSENSFDPLSEIEN